MATASIAQLKSGQAITDDFHTFATELGNWRADKGYSKEIFEYWLPCQEKDERRALETLVGRFLMRLPYDVHSQQMHEALGASLYTTSHGRYTGSYPEISSLTRLLQIRKITAGSVIVFCAVPLPISPWRDLRFHAGQEQQRPFSSMHSVSAIHFPSLVRGL